MLAKPNPPLIVKLMRCPEVSLPQTCALEAAKFLVEGGHVLLEPNEKDGEIKISRAGQSVMEVLNPISILGDGLYDVARFACASCGACVEIIDDDADMSFRLVDIGAQS
jgi:hypothetical protein